MSAPAEDETEVSLFGPGLGECVGLHIREGDWIVIDSCLDPRTGRAAILEYFETIGVAPERVRVVVVTHWHTDHVRGLTQILQACPAARIVCSAAMGSEEFLTLAYCQLDDVRVSRAMHEFTAVLKKLEDDGRSVSWAFANTEIHRDDDHGVTVRALSPSPETFRLCQAHFARMIGVGEPRRGLIEPGGNEPSIALHVQIGESLILLGADVEQVSDERRGWKAIVADPVRPKGKASAFKVPHHGAHSGHNGDVWERMLEERSVAMIAPLIHGRNRLPNATDRRRVAQLASEVYLTAPPEPRKRKKRDKAVERTIRETTRTMTRTTNDLGQVRLRQRGGEGLWRVALFGPAHRVSAP